jgi:nicotinamidase-related amidase
MAVDYTSFATVGPARALLVCVTETTFSRPPRRASALEASGATLLRRWESADWPTVFVEPADVLRPAPSYSLSGVAAGGREHGVTLRASTAFSDPLRRPRPDDFLFRLRQPSLLRQTRFARLFEGLGGPLLILLGDELGEIVLQTAIDGFLSNHPIIIVKDAATPGLGPNAETEASRASALPLLTCFARLMSAEELMREWTDAE